MWALWVSAALAGGTCGDEPVFGEWACGDVVSGDLLDGEGAPDQVWQYTCGYPYADLWQRGPEDVHTWVCPIVGEVEIRLQADHCDLDVYVLDDTCDPELGCLAGNTEAGAGESVVRARCAAAGDLLHVVVEGYDLYERHGECSRPDAGEYTLTFAPAEGVCDTLLLYAPAPGVSAETNTFRVEGATPDAWVNVLYGWGPGATPVPGCPGLSVSSDEVYAMGRARADDEGVAVLERWVPEVATGRVVVLHAVERETCRVSPGFGWIW